MTHFAIHSLPTVVSYILQLLAMAIFDKCPVCGEQSIVKPELGGLEHRVFKCQNGHTFKKDVKPKADDKEVMDHMPGWAKTLNKLSKTDK